MPLLPEKGMGMVAEEDVNAILQHAVIYMYELMKHNHFNVKFHINYLNEHSNDQRGIIIKKNGDEVNWLEIVKPDPQCRRLH
jgi:hypothetical protein